jgi:hypothetical protein
LSYARPLPFGTNRQRKRRTEWPFFFKLELEDGTLANPPTLDTAVPNWSPGDTIPLGRETLRVVEVRPGEEPDGGRSGQ